MAALAEVFHLKTIVSPTSWKRGTIAEETFSRLLDVLPCAYTQSSPFVLSNLLRTENEIRRFGFAGRCRRHGRCCQWLPGRPSRTNHSRVSFIIFSNFFQIVWNKTNFWLIQLEMKILSPAALSPIAQYLCPSWPCWPWWTFSTPSRYVEFDTLFISHCIQCFRINRRTGLRRKAAMVIWTGNRNLGGGALECGRLWRECPASCTRLLPWWLL